MTDFYKICRTLRLKMFFAVKGQNQDNISTIPMKLKKKSKFDQQMNNPTLDIFQQVITMEVTKQWESKNNIRKNNLSQHEQRALEQLSSDPNIITKKALL